MELIQMPRAMQNRGLTGWPQVYRVGKNEEPPPVGISYVLAEKEDFALVFRIMIPLLQRQHPYFDWAQVYESLVGEQYYPQRVYRTMPALSGPGNMHGAPNQRTEEVTLEELAADNASYVDIGVLEQMAMIPVFMTDIREAITANVTNSFMWTDGYNKKTGICTGSLVEQPMDKSLLIVDISHSIPDGVSAGLLTLVKTMTDVVNADVILTGGKSFFFTRDEARQMDIREQRRRIPRDNESDMFLEILRTHDMNYKNVLAFGDSDHPHPIELTQKLSIERLYSFFVTKRDTYGHSYEAGAGYGRWVLQNVPDVEVIHNTDWAKFFTKDTR